MKTILSVVIALILTALSLFPIPAWADSTSPNRNPQRFVTVAVLDFENSIEEQPRLGSQIGNLLTAFLSSEERLITVERAELEKIAAAIASNVEELLAGVESRDDLVERLKGVARKRALPTVSVNIEETHVGSPRFDPIAETEISHLLQELGFKLIDATQSKAKADIEITGQALSEFGTRRGNLVSCRGSVEIKAVNRKAGTIFAVDHQSEVSVDLAERFAAQSAVQQSAARLVERLVEKLAAVR